LKFIKFKTDNSLNFLQDEYGLIKIEIEKKSSAKKPPKGKKVINKKKNLS
jgi:hypothetical protein